MKNIFIKSKTYLLFVVLLVMVSVPLFSVSRVPLSNDLPFHINRIKGIWYAVINFKIPSHINMYSMNGYGWADEVMYPSLFLYIPGLIYQLTGNINISINMFMILVNVASALIIYKTSYGIFKNKNVSTYSTILFVLSYYRLSAMYTRGTMGEYLAICFIPLIIDGYIGVMRKEYKKWILLFLGLSFVLESHIISIIYISILLVAVSLCCAIKIFKNKKILISFIKTIICTILCNSFFLVPFIKYYISGDILLPATGVPTIKKMGNINTQLARVVKNFINNFVLIKNNIEIEGELGFILVILFFLVLTIVIADKKMQSKNEKIDKNIVSGKKIANAFLLIFCFNFLASLSIFTWTFFGHIDMLKNFFILQQFDYRELGRGLPFLILSVSFYVEYFFIKSVNIRKYIFIIFIYACSAITIFSYYRLLKYKELNNTTYDGYCNSDYLLKGIYPDKNYLSKILLIDNFSLDKKIFNGKCRLSSENIEISNVKKGYNNIKLDYIMKNDASEFVEVPLFCYDGYVAYDDDNNKLEIIKGLNTLIRIVPAKSSGIICIKWHNNLFLMADIISIVSILFLAIYSVIHNKMNK